MENSEMLVYLVYACDPFNYICPICFTGKGEIAYFSGFS